MTRIRSHLLTLLLLLGVVFLLVILDQTQRLNGVQDVGQRLTLPAEQVLSDWRGGVADFFGGFRSRDALIAENEALQEQLNAVSLVNVELTELVRENEQLRELLAYKEEHPASILLTAEVVANEAPAAVIGAEVSNLARAIRINQGTESGVGVGMAVVTSRGLVGHVTAAGRGWSKVVLVLDTTSSVSAVTQQSGAMGIVQGTDTGIVMRHIPHEERVEPGDVVMTAGLSGSVPPDIVIGTVESVERGDINPSQEAVIRPNVDFDNLNYVFVIRSFPATITEEAAPSAGEDSANTDAPN
ncbi:MAG: rod shape-determining protein MreC [Anaerolineales bacterium]|nr:rod shape-determining protein MreC [Anaerolineales bacterium]MCB9127988.1 rod shape-determining protein MreC [Ardenticatenales bacterium]MCB9172004.1 rod shape-determining protein MreC [Ardenticatenales bacterium]